MKGTSSSLLAVALCLAGSVASFCPGAASLFTRPCPCPSISISIAVRNTAFKSRKPVATAIINAHSSKDRNSSNNQDSSSLSFQHIDQVVSRKVVACFMAALILLSNTALPPSPLPGGEAYAEGTRVVGEISGSGLIFKDTLRVESFDDPKVQGVTLYLTNFERPLTERLQKDFFSDPSASSLTCVRAGPVKVADNIATGNSGEVSGHTSVSGWFDRHLYLYFIDSMSSHNSFLTIAHHIYIILLFYPDFSSVTTCTGVLLYCTGSI